MPMGTTILRICRDKVQEGVGDDNDSNRETTGLEKRNGRARLKTWGGGNRRELKYDNQRKLFQSSTAMTPYLCTHTHDGS